MKIGEVSAPSAILRSPVSNRGGASFLQTFGSVQRAYSAQRPARLYEVSERQERSRRFEEGRQRLEKAARTLAETAPAAAANSPTAPAYASSSTRWTASKLAAADGAVSARVRAAFSRRCRPSSKRRLRSCRSDTS